jgi:zinc protease
MTTLSTPYTLRFVWPSSKTGQGTGTFFFCVLMIAVLAKASAREIPPAVPPPKPITLPEPVVRQLSNGLKVMVIERHSLPILDLHLVVKAGAEADPQDLPGTAQMVAALLSQGTERRSAQQIAETIDSVGGTIETEAGWDNSFASLTVTSDRAEFAFDLLADIVLRPAFKAAEIERKRKQTLSALEISNGDPAYLADTTFTRMVNLGTPYGHPPDGTLDAVRRLTPADLRNFYAHNYRPSNTILAVIGDISPEESVRLAEKVFGEWAAGATGERELTSRPAARAKQVIVVDKPDAVQTEIRIGNLAIQRDSPDYDALTIANQILGGPAANRLFRALRSREGLTYGASSDLVAHRTLGSWEAKTSTRTSETIKTAQVMLDQMKQLRDHPISEQELETAKSYMIGHQALEFESAESVATQFLELMVYNLPIDTWGRFPERIRRFTNQEVWERTRQYLDPDRALILLVGNAAAFKKDLKKLGPARLIPLRSLDFASESLEKPKD